MGATELNNPYAAMGNAVALLGTDGFGDALLENVRRVLPFENASIIAFETRGESPYGTPVCLANRSMTPLVNEILGDYLSHSFVKCPYIRERLRENRVSDISIRCLDKAQTTPSDFYDMFDKIGLEHHVGFVSRSGGVFFYLGLGRSEKLPGFTDRDTEQLKNLWPFLEASIAKNVLLSRILDLLPEHQVNLAPSLIDMYRSHGLAQREAEVCSYAVSGYSVKETADIMQIAVNTVYTLRQRAYYKLNIRTQSELYSMCLQHIKKVMSGTDLRAELFAGAARGAAKKHLC